LISIVKVLSKIAQSEPLDSNPQKKEISTKALALEVIVAILRSLVDWSAELYEPPEDASSTSGLFYLLSFSFLSFSLSLSCRYCHTIRYFLLI
jgi:hypothetical protein